MQMMEQQRLKAVPRGHRQQRIPIERPGEQPAQQIANGLFSGCGRSSTRAIVSNTASSGELFTAAGKAAPHP